MHPSQRILCSKSEKLKGKNIVLGITGSIAAVEDVKLIRELIRHGAEVFPVMSREAMGIVHPNSVQFASGREPVTHLDGSVPYIEMCGEGGKADLMLIAPSTANTIGKIANGIDDTPVTTYATNALGSSVPILIAPAMHESMYDNPTVKENVKKLRELKVQFVEPLMAEQKAKMAGVEEIVAAVIRSLGPGDLTGKKVVVIAGATEEPIDDVRVISNRSSGATGIELASAAFERGGDVELWMGRHEQPLPPHIPSKQFKTIEELQRLVRNLRCDYCLVPAAISDYTTSRTKGKMPTRKGPIKLDLKPTPKVLKSIRAVSRKTLVGFKAEYDVTAKELEAKAKALLKEANLNLVVANNLKDVELERTKIIIIDKRGKKLEIEGTKAAVADRIWSAVLHGVKG